MKNTTKSKNSEQNKSKHNTTGKKKGTTHQKKKHNTTKKHINTKPIQQNKPNQQVLGALETLGTEWYGLRQHITDNMRAWADWVASSDPHEQPLPEPYQSVLDDFKRVLLLRVLRPEKFIFATSLYVARNLGRAFTESPAVILREIFPDSSAVCPIIFLLSQGSDPTAMIFKFANEYTQEDRLHMLSLGQGQGAAAEKLIVYAQKKVCLYFVCM
jgi:hypothetical protein